MIRKINIKKFGLFTDYLWDTSIGRDSTFKKLNIIYGRNYSGKTTLSRIFRCIELSQIHNDYLDCNFSIKLDDEQEINHLNFNEFSNKVRVYNSDFVRDNLSWLHNEDGTIKPFTILGAKNVEIEKRIVEINSILGKEEDSGLFFELNTKGIEVKTQHDRLKARKAELDKKLTDKAREIKLKANIYNLTTYQINSIKSDLEVVQPESILDDNKIESYLKLLKEEAKDKLKRFPESKPSFNNFFVNAKELVTRPITPSKPINDLINDAILQEWVRSGIELHKEKRNTCGFCGNTLPKELWQQLDEHFSKESEILRGQIQGYIEVIKNAKRSLIEFISLNNESFYSGLHDDLANLNKEWTLQIEIYSQNLDSLIHKLNEREKDIFRSKQVDEILDNSDDLYETLVRINSLINQNNERTDSLAGDQKNARLFLRFNEVAKFKRDIDYDHLLQELKLLQEDYEKKFEYHENINKQITRLTEEKRVLEAQTKDESRGAELVNQHLSHFFGHDELKLVAEGASPNMKFKIQRFNIDARNLSEGECSLISFCYFIAKIGDELKEVGNVNQLILYIDDPISSLDSNHVFFMFSLIETIIAKPKIYNQLFISTHNLDFLKYLKRLTIPKDKTQQGGKLKSSVHHLMIERESKSISILKLAPSYLKQYITEFNYLFEQMHRCSEEENSPMNHTYHYNFGNNTRKFLEAYLFYKYPNHRLTLDERLNLFFNNESVTINLINRVINEYSHLGEQFDRGLEPIDEEVIKKISRAIINRMKYTDQSQYDALVESLVSEN